MSALGPTALFDKSFLQSLSVDEAVWFGHYFQALGCPVFLLETLADLAKETSRGPENVVSSLAFKYPDSNAGACCYHHQLGQANLLGHPVPMDGRVPRSGGRHFEDDGQVGLRFEVSAEDRAFIRWRAKQFDDLEREFASAWRAALQGIDLKSVPEMLKAGKFDPSSCRTLEDIAALARHVFSAPGIAMQQLLFAVNFFKLPQQAHAPIYTRWRDAGSPSLDVFAPYAAYVVAVELFGYLAMAASLISSDRPANRTDLAYLDYLPFCRVFISSDKLHRVSAPSFLRSDQQFIWGQDLKADLAAINAHFMTFPEEVRRKGLMAFASIPPEWSLVAKIWERHGLTTTGDHSTNLVDRIPEDKRQALVEMILAARNAKEVRPAAPPASYQKIIDVKRVNPKKGSWWQIAEGYADEDQGPNR